MAHFSHFLIGLLLTASLTHAATREQLARKSASDWAMDGVSLFLYFIVLPWAQVWTGYRLYAWLLPSLKGTFLLGWGGALVAHLAIDYAWYWNHRLFHAQTPLWNLHAVHHSARDLDVFVSQRNSAWSFLFMSYFWIIPLVLYLAKDPVPFLTFAAVAAFINFWGHTRFELPRNSLVQKAISLAFIQPEDHFWHHSEENPHCNFATVFNFWDKIHGTWHQPGIAPKKLGFDLQLPLWKKILFPEST